MLELSDLKTYLKITDTSKDNQLNLAISNAKGFLKAYLGYSLELDASKVASFYGNDKEFELKHVNINSVSRIRYADDEFNPQWTNYDTATNFKVFTERGLVKTRDSIWPYTEITYSFWFDSWDDATNPTPADLKAILLDVAAMSYKNMGEISMWDLKSESVDGDQLVFKDVVGSLSPNALTLLDSYKIYDFSS